jgi:hypothetical protein
MLFHRKYEWLGAVEGWGHWRAGHEERICGDVMGGCEEGDVRFSEIINGHLNCSCYYIFNDEWFDLIPGTASQPTSYPWHMNGCSNGLCKFPYFGQAVIDCSISDRRGAVLVPIDFVLPD